MSATPAGWVRGRCTACKAGGWHRAGCPAVGAVATRRPLEGPTRPADRAPGPLWPPAPLNPFAEAP